MSLWKENTVAKPTPEPAYTPAFDVKEPVRVEPVPKPEPPRAAPAPMPAVPAAARKESLIAADLTIEGKIEGGGSVRIAGKFKGDVNVQGDLTIEAGAKLTGSVRADKVVISGELEGNVLGASSIDLQQTGVVIGDLKARSLAVAAGATMRGKAEFGGEDGNGPRMTESGTRQ
ncbi:MAG: polymer-forming cytoskeletal protein [Burkholderiales bacterium]|nr:polymer-forming cytoskeletal protein [Burkholderiales bacterium]